MRRPSYGRPPQRKARKRAAPRDLVWERTSDGRWTQVPRCESRKYRDGGLLAVAEARSVGELIALATEACRRAEHGDDAMLVALTVRLKTI